MKRTLTILLTMLSFTAALVAVPTAAGAQQGPPAPTLLEATDEGSYVDLRWTSTSKVTVKGINVYRNGDFQASVGDGNTYRDEGGKEGDVYYVVAYSHADQFSPRSGELTASGRGSGSSTSGLPPVPNFIHANYNGEYVNLVWRSLPTDSVKGVNVYRNGEYQASVGSDGNVYNDFDGRYGDVYYVVAYSHADQFSPRSNEITAETSELLPVKNFKATSYGTGGVRLTWDDAGGELSGWDVYRNGTFWKIVTRNGPGNGYRMSAPYSDFRNDYSVVDPDSQADRIAYYEVRPRLSVTRTIYGPSSLVATPILEQAYASRSHPQPAHVTGSNAASNAHAAAANQASAVAVAERKEANAALITFYGTVGVTLVSPEPASKVILVTAGINAYIQIGQAEHAEAIAREKMALYESCMSSPSCSQGGGGGDQIPNIPGTNTPGGCNEGGCWPA